MEEQKEKTEELLLNILPAETAEELKTKGKATARHYNMVSVLFTDFKGFTAIAEAIEPQQLVNELDECFINFDDIIAKYHIEKIKMTSTGSIQCTGLKVGTSSGFLKSTSGLVSIETITTSDISNLSSYNSLSNYAGLNHTHQITNNNIKVGDTTLASITTGTDNIAIGNNALNANSTGNRNIAIGSLALDTAIGASDNVCIGHNTITATTTGNNNVAISSYALDSNTTGSSNIAIGYGALTANTTASFNIAIGDACLYSTTTGGQNVAIGYNVPKSMLNGMAAEPMAMGMPAW